MPQFLTNNSSICRIPRIGLGTWQTNKVESVHQTLETAIDAGYRLIDTAFVYQNEKLIGQSLKKLFNSEKIQREDLFIITKLPLNGMQPASVDYFCNASLKALQLDYIDLYLIHFPVATKRTENDYNLFPYEGGELLIDNDVDLKETWKAMESLVDKGLVKSIGLSNFNSKQIQAMYDTARIKPSSLQVECHAYLGQYDLFEFCKKLNISFIAYSPLGTPGLPEYVRKQGNSLGFTPDKLLEDSRLILLSSKYQRTPAQILLRFLVQRGMTVIPKSSKPERIIENIKIFDFCLDDEDMEILKSMDKNLRYFPFDITKSFMNHPQYPFSIPF